MTPARDDSFHLVITHPDGFAHLKSADGGIPKTIKLTEWARVEGTFRIGKEAVPDITLSLSSSGITSFGDGQPNIFTQHEVKTGRDGHFVFELVVPGRGYIGRDIVFMVDDGATEVASSKRVPTAFVSGETTTVNIGGDGRAVVGRLAPPANHVGKFPWKFASIWLRADIPQPKWPEPPKDIQDDETRRKAWWVQWQGTDEGKAMLAASKKADEEQRKRPTFHVSVDHDGTFQIDDVEEGQYVLSMRYDRKVPGHLTDYHFPVPSVGTDDVGKPLDIGVLRMESVSKE